MSQLPLLVELQNLDIRSDENAVARNLIGESLADTTQVSAAAAALDASQKQSSTLTAQLRTLELETSGLAAKLKEVNGRLYGGRISNAKELAGLNQDEKMLQRRKDELEEQSLALMEQIERVDNTSAEKRAALDRVTRQAQVRDQDARDKLEVLEATARSLTRKKDALRAQLPPETLRVYDHLRQTKKGRAVSVMKGSNCAVCGYEVPSGLIARVKTGATLVFCTNCERILAP